jgi:hypothetical protein
MFNPRWTLQMMVHPMSQSKQPQKNHHYGLFFLLVELETKPTTFYYPTLKYHNT